MAFVGCGTAKCGSTSLWHLLHDSGVDCKHERHLIGYELPWQYDRDSIASKIKHLKSKRDEYGEIAFYFLPYIPKMMAEIPNLKVICLKRNLKDTVRSLLNTILENPWAWDVRRGWNKCYPRMTDDVNACAHEWWRTYYEIAETYERLFPNFKIFDIDSLNSRKGQEAIFDFLDIENRVYKDDCHYNKSNYEQTK